jgi:orotate phosphoribosyltransferase
MREPTAKAFLDLVAARGGHFRLESGHHGRLWLDLDSLFAKSGRLTPFISALANRLRPHGVFAVCGPLLGGAFLAQLVAQALDVEFWFTERVIPAGTGGLYRARYVLPRALALRVRDKRVAMVDDVISAGSALRGTFVELRESGAKPVVAGALLVLGSAGDSYFAEQQVAVEAVARGEDELWLPTECPLCAGGVPLEDVVSVGDPVSAGSP